MPGTIHATSPAGYAVLQVVDKITAQRQKILMPTGGAKEFGTIRIVLRSCHKSAPDESKQDSAFVEVFDQKVNAENKIGPVFTGWMFSASPSISALEHPVYDVTLLECSNAPIKLPESSGSP